MPSLLTSHERQSDPFEGIRILGWVKMSLLDYPGKVASTLFFEGCNLRCPYCHNPDLVISSRSGNEDLVDPGEVLSYLETYRRMLEGVCITGGEPLLQPGLPALCDAIRTLGLQVKVDTNGSLPDALGGLVRDRLVNYVAVDIKGPPGKIRAITGSRVSEESLIQSVEATVRLLQGSGLPYELRTTVVPGLLEREDLLAIGRWLQNGAKYVLQQFRPGRTLDPDLRTLRPHPPEYLRELSRELAGYFAECTVRGLG